MEVDSEMKEKRKVRAFNRIRLAWDRDLNPGTVLDRACASHPDSVVYSLGRPLPYDLLECCDLTPRMIRDFVCRVAETLVKEGLKRFDRVAIYKANSLDYVLMSQAVVRAGGIAVPINGGMSLEGLQYYLEYTGCRTLICDSESFERVVVDPKNLQSIHTWYFPTAPDGFRARCIAFNAVLNQASGHFEPIPIATDQDVILAHTSGTTGFPKAVISTAGSFRAGLRSLLLGLHPSSPNTRCLFAIPYNHLIAHTTLMTTMLANWRIWLLDDFSASAALETIEREKIHVNLGFPDLYINMLNEGLEHYCLDHIRAWVSVADSSHEAHMKEFTKYGAYIRLFGYNLFKSSAFVDTLGSSEVGGGATARFFFNSSPQQSQRMIGRSTFPLGPRIKIADELGRKCAAGEVGRIMVKGPTLFKGYWNAHDKLHGTMVGGWWWTGDLGYRDAWGRYYHLDRATDVVNTDKGSVYTLVVEETILKHPDVAEACVFSTQEDDQQPERVMALCAPFQGQTLDTQDVREWANSRLNEDTSIARVIGVTLEDVPRGLTGKVLKRQLREKYAG